MKKKEKWMKIAFYESDATMKAWMKEHLPKSRAVEFFDARLDETTKATDAEIVSVHVGSVCSAKNLEKFKNLKSILTRTTGTDHIDLSYCEKKKIDVFSVPRYGATTVAEFTFLLLLNLTKKLTLGQAQMKAKKINQSQLVGQDLAGKTIGLIGLGDIGSHVAAIAAGFGMKVLGVDPHVKRKSGVKIVSFETLLTQSDIISIHCPASCSTTHILDEKAFAKMKKGVILINTARGCIVKTKALYAALKNGTVAGAGLDVLEEEGLFFSVKKLQMTKSQREIQSLNEKISKLKNVSISPHMAFNSHQSQIRVWQSVEKILNEYEKKTKRALRQTRK